MSPTAIAMLCVGIALAAPIVAGLVYARREERVDVKAEVGAPVSLVERLRAMLPPTNQEWAAVDYTIQEAMQALEDQHYFDLEHEHLGCPVACTGIYARRSRV